MQSIRYPDDAHGFHSGLAPGNHAYSSNCRNIYKSGNAVKKNFQILTLLSFTMKIHCMNDATARFSPEAINTKILAGTLLLLGILLIPFVIQQFSIALNTNHAWLLIVAERYLGGGVYGRDFFEPNPPMSVLIYVPQYLLHAWAKIPIEYTPSMFTFITIALSSILTTLALKSHRLVPDPYLGVILVTSYALACIFVPGNLYFGERDHFVFMALFPLLLMQTNITAGARPARFPTTALFLGGGLILLIKPHYGLFPILVCLDRMIRRKSILSVFRDPDFIGLTLSLAAYAGILYFGFPEYINIMLPALLELYIGALSDNLMSLFFLNSFPLIPGIIVLFLLDIPKANKNIILYLWLCATIAFFLHCIQGKDYSYHLIPGDSFLYIGYCVFFWSLLDMFFHKDRQVGRNVLMSTSILLFFSFTILSYPPFLHFPTHKEYANLPLARTIKACGQPCPHFIFSESMEIAFQSSLYAGETPATRYPGLWWLYALYGKKEYENQTKNHLSAIAEDFKRYQPKMLVIANNLTINGDENFDLVALMNTNPELRPILQHYRFDHVLHDDRKHYFTGTSYDYSRPILYDVYFFKQ